MDQKPSEPVELERMVALLRAFVAGRASRAEVAAFTRAIWPDTSKQGGPFPGNGSAATVFDSIWNAEERSGDSYVLREEDFRDYLRLLTEGEPFARAPRVAQVRATAERIARALERTTSRFWVDGLGWHESVRFSSPYTGRAFDAVGPLWPPADNAVVDVRATTEATPELIVDLLDTLAIDLDDLFDPPNLDLGSWSLWRQDDNGVRAVVATFSARVKAQRALAKFEALPHRQMYWLEERVAGG
jgi:hypothetical protein